MRNGLWIPNELLQIEELSAAEKIILSVILSFAQGDKGTCIAFNSTIAEAANLKLSTVAHSIPKLIEEGYLVQVGSKKRRELKLNFRPAKNAKYALDECKICTRQVQNMHSTNAKNAFPLYIYKEREEEGKKREGKIAPPEEDKTEVLNNDKGGNEKDSERVLSDFWKQELSI